MLIQRAFSYCCKSAASRRFISQSAKNFESKISDTSKVSSTASASSSGSSSVVGSRMVAPDNFEKWILVWMKKFPKGEVPDRVKEELLYQTKSRARVKAANWMTAIAIVGCVLVSISGRRARDSGEGFSKKTMEWHKKTQEEYQAQQAAKAS